MQARTPHRCRQCGAVGEPPPLPSPGPRIASGVFSELGNAYDINLFNLHMCNITKASIVGTRMSSDCALFPLHNEARCRLGRCRGQRAPRVAHPGHALDPRVGKARSR